MDGDIAELLEQTTDVDEPLSSNSLWDDVVPIPQNDGVHTGQFINQYLDEGIIRKLTQATVVNIAYTPVFREAMDFFRAVLASNERSERVLALTKRVISLNAANYTAWHLRRQCLFDLGKDLTDEMAFVEECAENNPKNYQIWYHRRALVEKLNNGTNEPQFVSQILHNTDAKNYHAWAHRQWAISRFQIWDGEMEFADYLIKNDVRNNSAWNHRWFVLTRGNTIKVLDDKTADRELAYAREKAELAPSNECPYSYIRAIVSRSSRKISDDAAIAWMQELLASSSSSALSHVRALLVDALVEKGDNKSAVAICVDLAGRYDTIRATYWKWRAATISANAQ